jgi:Kef-type K+ transport system membrane component KefB
LLHTIGEIFYAAPGGTQLLVAIGFVLVVAAIAGRLAKQARLPTVTGYIAVGVLIGPYGLHILTHEMVTDHLRIFADIALVIIAFTIGKLLDFRFTNIDFKRPIIIPSAEAFGAFILVTTAALLVGALASGSLLPESQTYVSFIVPLALLLGALSMDTAPASSLHVVKEYGGRTLLTRCLMMSVAVDNALAIGVFSIIVVVVRDLFMSMTPSGLLVGIALALVRIVGALLWGALVAVIIHPFIEAQKEHAPTLMLTLGSLIFCAGFAELFTLPSILAGMSLGMVMSNSYRCERSAFEAIERFEPPMFAIFFVIAGAHFDFAAFAVSTPILVAYIVARFVGKYLGSRIATKAVRAEDCLRQFLGLALVPQGGIAIGLVFSLQALPEFEQFWAPITTVVLTAVALSEVVGPPLTHWSLMRSGERELEEAHQTALEEHAERSCD